MRFNRFIKLARLPVGVFALSWLHAHKDSLKHKTEQGISQLIPNSFKASLINGLTNKKNVISFKEIAYGEHARQLLDIYRPKQLNKGDQLPVLVFVHGGAWDSGSKDEYLFLAESFTSAGFVVAIINYRLAPKYQYPSYVKDTALALKWVFENIATYQGNNNAIFALGHSAGAFNLVTAVNNSVFFKEIGFDVSNIKAVIGVAGPYNYDFRCDDTAYAFPKTETPENVMPIHFIRENPVPHLLLTAEKDSVVEPYNAKELAYALEQKGGQVSLSTIKRANHVTVIGVFAKRISHMANTRQVVLSYLDKLLTRSV